jgi:hypothetical protein
VSGLVSIVKTWHLQHIAFFWPQHMDHNLKNNNSCHESTIPKKQNIVNSSKPSTPSVIETQISTLVIFFAINSFFTENLTHFVEFMADRFLIPPGSGIHKLLGEQFERHGANDEF